MTRITAAFYNAPMPWAIPWAKTIRRRNDRCSHTTGVLVAYEMMEQVEAAYKMDALVSISQTS